MRYTEVRMSKIAAELLKDIEKILLILYLIMMNQWKNQHFYLPGFPHF